MMASIFVIDRQNPSSLIISSRARTLSGHFPIISFFAMLREIKALNLVFVRDPESDRHVHDLEDHQGAYDCQNPGDYNANQLIQKLVGIPVNPAGRQGIALRILEYGIYYARSKHSGKKCA